MSIYRTPPHRGTTGPFANGSTTPWQLTSPATSGTRPSTDPAWARTCLTARMARHVNAAAPRARPPACETTPGRFQLGHRPLAVHVAPARVLATEPQSSVEHLPVRGTMTAEIVGPRLTIRVAALHPEDRRALAKIDPLLPGALVEILGLTAIRNGPSLTLEHQFEVRVGDRYVGVQGLTADRTVAAALDRFPGIEHVACVYADRDVGRYRRAAALLGTDLAPYALTGGDAMRTFGFFAGDVEERGASITVEWSRGGSEPSAVPPPAEEDVITVTQDTRVRYAMSPEELPTNEAFWRALVAQLDRWILPRLQGIAEAQDIGARRFQSFEAFAPQLVLTLRDGPLAMRVGDFMRLLEAHGLVGPFDRAMIGSVLALLQANPTLPAVSVNVSSALLNDSDFPSWLIAAAAERSVAPERLRLELTEHGELPDLATAQDAIRRLAAQGFAVYIDDVTEGHSGQYLELEGIAGVKLSKRTVNLAFLDMEAPENERRRSDHETALHRLENVAALAQARGWTVIAEGIRPPSDFERLKTVSQEEMVARLAALGIVLVQGFGVDRPRSIAERGLRLPPEWASAAPTVDAAAAQAY